MQDNYLAKWLNNELSEEEIIQFKKTDEYASYQKIISASNKLKAPNFDKDKVLKAIENEKYKSITPKVIKLNPYTKLIRVAVAVALICGLAYFYTNSLDETISTDYAQNDEVVLPDASEIILNAESKIAYNKNKWDKTREVSLEGEAFFKVAKGKKFTVSTSQGTVTVLGTQFNVETRKNFFEVTCYEGLVSVTYENRKTKIPAGSSLMVINGKITPISQIKTSSPSWIQNESSFNSIPLEFVLNEFQRQFNIIVNTKNIDTKQLFTGTFNNENLELALKSISIPSQINYTLKKNKVLFYAKK